MKKFKLNRKNLSSKLPETENSKLKGIRITGLYGTILFILFAAGIFTSCNKDDTTTPSPEPWEQEVALLKTAMEPYNNFDAGVAAGYNIDLTGYRTQMGYHYLNANLLDNTFDLNNPEVLLYVHGPDGILKLVAVEYATIIDDINNPPPAPEGFTGSADVWQINTEFNVWTLHVWIVMENPNGIFAPLNPMLP